jgi:hypothetical protein
MAESDCARRRAADRGTSQLWHARGAALDGAMTVREVAYGTTNAAGRSPGRRYT